MNIEVVDREYFQTIQMKSKIAFDEVWFHDVNQSKTNEIIYLLFKASKYKAGMIAGITDNKMELPYSAPFAMPEFFRYCKIEEIDVMLELLDRLAADRGVRELYFRLPPFFYDESNISKLLNGFFRNGYGICAIDLNYHIKIGDMNSYLYSLHRNARKNLNQALAFDFELVKCVAEKEKKRAYDIIKNNRDSKGYYLSMSWAQMKITLNNIDHEVFILSMDGSDVASAIIFRVARSICQVVYWGDVSGYSDKRPMNLLAFKIVEYYQKQKLDILDIGPAMVNGIPNVGLCDFKESIGCIVSSKFAVCKEI